MASTHGPQPTVRRPPRPRHMAPPSRGMAIASLVLGILGLPTFGLCGVGALVGLILGIIALVRASKAPAVYGGKGIAIGGIVTSVFSMALIPILAAIAIPSLLRARVAANESVAINDIRTVISAEETYSIDNGGYYDSLECLSNPHESCMPGYPADAPPFLDTELAMASVKSGYVRTFYPGAAPNLSPEQASRFSPTSIESYAYVAIPQEQNLTGVRAFCGDSTARICQFLDGEVPPIQDGMCPVDCETLNR